MIITTKKGRRKSILTPQEIDNRAGDIISSLTEAEKDLFFGLLDDEVEERVEVTKDMLDHRYHTQPVSMEQFIEDPYYLGESCSTLYPALRQDLIDLFSHPYREVVLTGGIGVGKCVSGDTEIYDPVNGVRYTAHQMSLLGRVGCASFSKGDGAMVSASAMAEPSGMKETGTLRLASGKSIRVSLDHPILTPYGWREASSLKPGDLVATARRMPAPVNPLSVSDEEVKWVAYMLADGDTTTRSMTFTNESDAIHREFEDCTVALGAGVSERRGCSFVAMDGKAKTVRPLATGWVRKKYGLQCKAIEKRVPAEFYGLDDRQLGLFLNRIWACDAGWVRRRSGGHWEVGISFGSEGFVRDIQQLLLRFGINARVRERKMGEQRSYDKWSLQVLGVDDVVSFLDAVGMVTGKEGACQSAMSMAGAIVSNSNVDITPMNREAMVRVRQEIGPIPKRAYWPRPDFFESSLQGSQMENKVFRVFASDYKLPEWCRWWGDVFWDPVDSFECSGVVEPVYDLEVPGTANFAPSGVIIHNTFILSIAICRVLYELSCLVNPQKTFGLSSGTEMVIPLISKNLILAREVMKTAVDDKIKESEYFMKEFAPKISKDNTHFSNNIRVMVGSYGSERILGSNVFSVGLDETNFPPKRKDQQITTGFGQRKTAAHFDIVEKVYRDLVRRIKSRFQKAGGDFPGMVLLASSAATLESFTERKIRESIHDPDVFIRDHTQWTAKPKDNFCGEVFWVICSTSSLKTRILDEDDYELITDDYLEENNAWIIDIPVEFRNDFEVDIENALRDIAGISTQAISAFVQRTDAVDGCVSADIKHAFNMGEWTAGGPGQFIWSQLCKQFERRLPGGYTETGHVPALSPKKMRWCHVDTSVSGDATGFAVGHIDRWVEVVRRSEDGERYMDYAPFYYIDIILRINPPSGEQIYLPDVRRLVYDLMGHGYSLLGFSTDKYQYVEMHQQIKRRGINTELISTDESTEPYDELKRAIYEDRIRYHKYEPFIEELKLLEYDRIKGKIDHPQAGSKDCSDAVAGVVYGLFKSAARLPIGVGSDTPKGKTHEHQWVSNMIPSDSIDVEDARAMKEESEEAGEYLPILFGD